MMFLMLCGLLQSDLLSQVQIPKRSREGPARAAINQALQSWRGGMYEANDVVDIDSLKGDMRFFVPPLEDPYGSLANCFVFTTRMRLGGPALPESSIDLGEFNAVGVFRAGSILWISDTTIFESRGRLLTTRDINDDGVVEILTEWNDGRPYVDAEVWIHSWNGATGWRINAVHDEKYSVIVGLGTGFLLFDAEGDGILELKNITVADGSLTYSWNGQQYGSWPSTPHLSETTWLPRDNFSITISCSVLDSATLFSYSYGVASALTSMQRVSFVCIEQRADSVQVFSPPGWQRGGVIDFNMRLGWESVVMDHKGHILPGQSRSGFKMVSEGIPAIVNYAAQAYNASPRFEMFSDTDLETGLRNDIENNAVWGRTIGPADPPTLFNALTFLDTLKSYVMQSRTLSWIASDAIANKYARLLDTARANLMANIRGVTKAKLDSVLINVHADSASTLTSEAYALIRFNTEYVLNKLREEDAQFAEENKSSSTDATASNSARHLAKTGNNLHEVFASGGEIFYRRSADEASTWDQTHQINTAVGENSHPCIATTQHASVEIVWQRRIALSKYEVWHAYSQDEGASWSAPAILPNAAEVEVSGYQTEGPMPVIAESFATQYTLVVVYCSSEGLRYRISEDEGATWQAPHQDELSSEFNDRVRYPSLAGGSSYASLLYDYVGQDGGPFSRTFNGSTWSGENSVGKGTGVSEGAFSSVAINAENNPIAAWSGIANSWTRSVIFRAGYADNKWDKWFVAFGQGQLGPDWVHPSVTYYKRDGGQDAIAIVNHTSSNYIKLIRYGESMVDPPTWEISTLSESGAWANITHENATSGKPFHCWTDQGTFPYKVVAGSSSKLFRSTGRLVEMTSLAGVSWKRRAVVYHPNLRATLAVEFEPMKIVNANGDTSIVRFKTSPSLSRRERDSITFSNMWDYLGSGVVSVPANARRLVFTKQFVTRGPSIAKRRFFFRVLNTSGISIGMLDTTANSGTLSINIAPYAGMNVILRPQVTLVGIDPPAVTISVGDVFTMPDDPTRQERSGGQSKQSQPKKKQLK